MSVVGTAGHVDHGKSTLLLAITGRDPDRWEEEKRRGLTIDLGFAWTTLPSGREVSFVDVPGHERFIKNMLAGIESIDMALFVVAADEGWMPQSEEHLAILDLLEVERAVIALTKVDTVDAELAELAGLEVMEKLEGTSLAGAEVIEVAAPKGEGVDAVVAALDAMVTDVPAGSDPRLWVDRRFTIPGAGTVVTGTLLGGPVAVGDSLMAYPSGRPVRVRGIESHEAEHQAVNPHRRVALNLADAPEDLGRGSMLGRPDRWSLTDRFTAHLRPARYVEELKEKGAFHVHVGTVAVPARIRVVDDGWLVTLDRPLPLRYGDRFIFRETGRRAVVAGGRILDPGPPRRGRRLRQAAALPDGMAPEEAASALLELRGAATLEALVAETGSQPTTGRDFGPWRLSETELGQLSGRAVTLTDEFHAANPLRPGIPLATLTSRVGTTQEVAIALAEESAELETDGTVVWRAGHVVELDGEQSAAWDQANRLLEEGGFQPPLTPELPIDSEVIHQLVRAGDLVRISSELVYLAKTAARIEEVIAAMPPGFTVAEFRDALGVSRKYAVPILEWADERRLTRRRGDMRTPVAEPASG